MSCCSRLWWVRQGNGFSVIGVEEDVDLDRVSC